MFQATRQISEAFTEKELKFRVEENDQRSYLEAGFNGDNVKAVKVRFISTDNDNDVAVRAYRIVSTNADKLPKVLKAINELNNKYRYIKFVVDEDNDINAEYDLAVRTGNVGPVCVEIFIRFMNIIDEAYPVLMQAMWA